MKKYLAVIAISVVSALSAVFLYEKFFSETPQIIYKDAVQTDFVSRPIISSAPIVPTDFTLAAEASTPAVVNITAVVESNSQPGSFLDLFDQQRSRSGQVTGSGVLITRDGYVVTNNHVIEKGDNITVTMTDQSEHTAKLIGRDPSTDIALLKIDGYDFPHLSFENSDDVKVGQWVMAIGSPLELSSTVTAGIVSAKGRSIDILGRNAEFPIESFIQTDAAVNPGNSGGALINTSGKLIGINTAIKSNTGGYSGYSFAVPSNIVAKVVSDLRDFGAVQRAFLGVSISRKIPAELNIDRGVFVEDVRPGSGAIDAGLKRGDVIKNINSVQVNTMPELLEQAAQYRPGDFVDVDYIRNGKNYKTKVELRNLDGTTRLIKNNESELTNILGARFGELNESELENLGIGNGVKISMLGNGALRLAGIKPGFVITAVNEDSVADVEDLMDKLGNETGIVYLEGVYPEYDKIFSYSVRM